MPDDRCDSSSARLCCRAGRAHRQKSDRHARAHRRRHVFWADFFDYSTARGPAYIPDTAREGPYPLHAVCVVGFNELGWIVKNSFGPAWGNGLRASAIIPYGLCALLGAPPPPGGFRGRRLPSISTSQCRRRTEACLVIDSVPGPTVAISEPDQRLRAQTLRVCWIGAGLGQEALVRILSSRLRFPANP